MGEPGQVAGEDHVVGVNNVQDLCLVEASRAAAPSARRAGAESSKPTTTPAVGEAVPIGAPAVAFDRFRGSRTRRTRCGVPRLCLMPQRDGRQRDDAADRPGGQRRKRAGRTVAAEVDDAAHRAGRYSQRQRRV